MSSKQAQAVEILQNALGGAENKQPEDKKTEKQPPEIEEAPLQTESDLQTEPKDEEPATMADLAEMLGCDVADLYDVQIPMPDGGVPASLGSLKDAERRARKLDGQLQSLQSERKTLEKELNALRSRAPAAFGGMPPELDTLRMQAAQWYAHVNNNPEYWKQLRENDSAEYAAAYTEAQTKANQAATMFQQGMMQWQATQQQQLNDLLSEKRAKLAEKDPAWADDNERKSRYQIVSDWLREEGAEVPDNLSDVLIDPGWTQALFKAAKQAKNLGQIKEGAPKKIGSAKLRRGTLRSGTQEKAHLAELVKRARDTRRTTDKKAAAAAILESAFNKK